MVSNKICYPFVLSTVNIYLAEFPRNTGRNVVLKALEFFGDLFNRPNSDVGYAFFTFASYRNKYFIRTLKLN